MSVRTRIAPSPTGFVHIGTIYNALFAHALAKSKDGQFILRIEDTDQKRLVEGASEELYRILDEFNLTPDEGPEQGGKYAPYIQSKRMESGIYRDAAESLVEKGFAYYCFLTTEELKKIREENPQGEAFRSPYRDKDIEESKKRIEDGEEYVIRLKVPEDEDIVFQDAILGEVTFHSSEIDDQVLLKSDGFPTYHLAVVVDDNAMEITHITRGYEWLSSTPKHILLYRYLDLELPVFAHSGLILDPTGGKLSKRKGNVSAKQFLEEGYLPEAMINFMMLMGWSPPIERAHGEKEREIFSHEEFIDMYSLENRTKSNAVFDREKLYWFNQQYLSAMDTGKLVARFLEWIEKYDDEDKYKDLKDQIEEDKEYFGNALELEKTRIRLLSEVPESMKLFYETPEADDHTTVKQIKKLSKEEYQEIVKTFLENMEDLGEDTSSWDHEEWEQLIRDIASNMDLGAGKAFMSLRYAVTGSSVSPPLFEIMVTLEKDELIKRLKNSI